MAINHHTMTAIISSILFGLVATVAAAVIALPNAYGANQTGLLDNVTNAPRVGAIDPRFTTHVQPEENRLSATSCLMNAVNAMMELALENFTEPIRPRNYLAPGYHPVMIVPFGLSLRSRVEARYLLWSIWEGIRWMISHQSFRQLIIRGYWDGDQVCGIWIGAAREQPHMAGSNDTMGTTARSEKLPIHQATVEPTQGLSIMDVRHPVKNFYLRVSVTAVGEILDRTDVFLAIFAALEYMAHFPNTDEVGDFEVSPDGGGTTIAIQDHAQDPAVRPPFLEYQWVILSLGQIPEYMLQQGRFTEVSFEMSVDGVLLGEGLLYG